MFTPDARQRAKTEAGGEAIAPERRRGRGSVSNRSGRFETENYVPFDDGWGTLEDLPPFATEVQIERPKTIITRNTSPDIAFDRSINPYRGCEHGCAYCYARPTHAFMGFSAGLDFESRLFAKPGAARLLERELSAKGYKPKVIAIGTNTDPYQPIEREYRIMREVLEVLDRASHPVAIVTKSALVARDIDILASMAERGLAKVALSVTTLDARLARRLEPRAATPQRRLEAMRRLSAAGIPTAVMAAPVIPGLTDQEIEAILDAASVAGAVEAGYIMLRLPHEVAGLFKEWLLKHAPDRYRRVVGLVRDLREGKDNDPNFHSRMAGTGPFAWMIGRRFEIACDRLKLNRTRPALRTDLFMAPFADDRQLALF